MRMSRQKMRCVMLDSLCCLRCHSDGFACACPTRRSRMVTAWPFVFQPTSSKKAAAARRMYLPSLTFTVTLSSKPMSARARSIAKPLEGKQALHQFHITPDSRYSTAPSAPKPPIPAPNFSTTSMASAVKSGSSRPPTLPPLAICCRCCNGSVNCVRVNYHSSNGRTNTDTGRTSTYSTLNATSTSTSSQQQPTPATTHSSVTPASDTPLSPSLPPDSSVINSPIAPSLPGKELVLLLEICALELAKMLQSHQRNHQWLACPLRAQ
jgi:hypothetical protein